MELLQQCMEWNAEAAERCKVLYAGDAQAANICLLFSSLGADYDAAPGCLLQQVWRLLGAGAVQSAFERSSLLALHASCMRGLGRQGFDPLIQLQLSGTSHELFGSSVQPSMSVNAAPGAAA